MASLFFVLSMHGLCPALWKISNVKIYIIHSNQKGNKIGLSVCHVGRTEKGTILYTFYKGSKLYLYGFNFVPPGFNIEPLKNP